MTASSPKQLTSWKPRPGQLVRYTPAPFSRGHVDVLGMVLRRYSVKRGKGRVAEWCVDVAHPGGVDERVSEVHVGPLEEAS